MNRRPTALQLENGVQWALTVSVGIATGVAAWSNVLWLAREHGQHGWHAWVIAACTETLAMSALLEVRRRHRLHLPLFWPLVLMVAAGGVQLFAQLAAADPHWLDRALSALPAITFLILVKLTLARVGSTPSIAAGSIAPPIDPVAPIATPIDPVLIDPPAIEGVDPVPIEPAIDPIDPAPIDPVEAIRSSRHRSIEDLREEFDRLVKDGQLRADSSVEDTRKALNCAPKRARIMLGREAA